jgi:ATP-binding cassette subfamily B protein
LLWRAHLFQALRERVNGVAALKVLPAYKDLPGPIQDWFAQQWQQPGPEVPNPIPKDQPGVPQPRRLQDNAALLEELGVPQPLFNQLLTADPARLGEADQELLWRAHLFDRFRDLGSAESDYLARRARPENISPDRIDGSLSDHGLLSRIIRSHIHDRAYGPNAGVLASWNAWMWKRGNTYYLTWLLIVAVALALLRGLMSFLQQDMAARATLEASTRLRRAVYHHTFRLGTLAIKALGPTEAVSILTRYVEAVHDALYVRLTVFLREPFKFGLLLVFALLVNWKLALIFLLSAALVWLIGGQVAVYFRRQGRQATNRAAEQLTLIRESLMLMRLVKVYLMELFNQSRVERQLARYAAAQRTRYRGEAIYRPFLIFLGLLAALGLLYVAGWFVLADEASVASTVTLCAALVSLYWPLEKMLESRRYLRRGRESAQVLFEFLDRPGEVGQVVGAEFLPPLSKRLEFDGVTLQEPGTSRMLLENVSFSIAAGQRIGLMGLEDLEKHALVYLIPRFLDPTTGEIRIDQHNLRWVTLDSLRNQIAMVLQHSLVFHDTVANNIRCGDPAFTLPQIIEAAKIAHAHHFIQKLPLGYETPIGELRHSLNSGEQFRIALARAILRDPALLIIEEPLTPLDEDTKSLLDDTFARVLPGRTVIFLPHRISTLKGCDQVILLHKGRIEGIGTHRDLLADNALYRHVYYLEFSELAEQM